MRTAALLAALVARVANAQAPAYSADSIVDAASFSKGPFAPNSIISIFGSTLAYGTATLPEHTTTLPLELANAEVYIDAYKQPLFYVSPTQINLLVQSNLVPGTHTLYVVRQGIHGPQIPITLAATAPELFATSDGFAIAQHADYSLITTASPAVPGEIVVLWGTGLGATDPPADPNGIIPFFPGNATTPVQVLLNGSALDPGLIKYAGLSPGSAGVYQVNVQLPNNLPANPQIQLSAGGQTSATNILLAAQPSAN
ncbi:MAG TPA: hypothetical protein VKV17_01420 [Bryobacteraceae bacterium]|nr:hypothetical protein [Bryobacteraceae bacterium]